MDEVLRRPGRPAGRTGTELLAVARTVLLECGFAGTTMDEVARRARISKASLYREHPSKDALFAAVVRDWAFAGRDAMRPYLDRLINGDDARADLIALADVMQVGILSTDVLRMRRLITSEAERCTEIAHDYLEHSWEHNIGALRDALHAVTRQGRLDIDDPHLAADQLTWLIVGAPLNRRLLTPSQDPPSKPTPVEHAVETFLARFGSTTKGTVITRGSARKKTPTRPNSDARPNRTRST